MNGTTDSDGVGVFHPGDGRVLAIVPIEVLPKRLQKRVRAIHDELVAEQRARNEQNANAR